MAALDGSLAAADVADAGAALFAEATGARVSAGEVVAGRAPWLGAAARLRGALLAARLAEALRERFDEDWWRNPRCGPWLATEVCAPGNVLPALALASAAPTAAASALPGADAPTALAGAADVTRAARAAEAALV